MEFGYLFYLLILYNYTKDIVSVHRDILDLQFLLLFNLKVIQQIYILFKLKKINKIKILKILNFQIKIIYLNFKIIKKLFLSIKNYITQDIDSNNLDF
jgi:hypothetical protein